jgi:mono/diheme cytochrome c family protein
VTRNGERVEKTRKQSGGPLVPGFALVFPRKESREAPLFMPANAAMGSREARNVTRLPRFAVAAIALALTQAAASEDRTPPPLTNAGIARAWQVLRAVDCARCHGKSYEGLAAPSIVDYARTQSREMFLRAVLDGDPPRGMPGYRGNQSIAGNIDDIYRYFLGRANGTIAPESRPRSLQR